MFKCLLAVLIFLTSSLSLYAQENSNIKLWTMNDIVEKNIIDGLQNLKASYQDYGAKPINNGLIVYGKGIHRKIVSYSEPTSQNNRSGLSEALLIEHGWDTDEPWTKIRWNFFRVPKAGNKLSQRFDALDLVEGKFNLKIDEATEREFFGEFIVDGNFQFSFLTQIRENLDISTRIILNGGRTIERLERKDLKTGILMVSHRFQRAGDGILPIEFKMVIHPESQSRYLIPEVRYYYEKNEISRAEYEKEMAERVQNRFYIFF